ncbi:MAG TPA: DUF6526 family protein [Thermoanaerobaculia bacterium]|nr:DUF6526 family protein [Thermoanaerobaculia bacterium]
MLGEKMPQTYANHSRIVPLFHFAVFGLLVVNLLYRLYVVVRYFGWGTLIDALLAVALVLFASSVRTFDTRLQDRIIRLEMRLRLARLLPPDLHPRIHELRPGQLIALRFAPDAEVPGLVDEIFAGRLTKSSEIKQRIKTWEPDYFRV